jgi:thymidylate synthase (FAD)
MRINNPSFEIWDQEPGIDGIYRQIERVGRVCYKSEDHQTADSARPFVERMIKNEHYAMLEHGSVFLTISLEGNDKLSAEEREQKANNYISNRFSRVVIAGGKAFVSTNLRVLAENRWLDDLAFLTEPTDHHERRVTVHFTTQIAITREFNRHRADSMAEQSTRYCNYSKAKFGNEITVNLPTWVKQQMMDSNWARQISGGTLTISGHDFLELGRKVVDGSATDLDNWVFANLATEKSYMNLIAAGRKPQEARVVLPLDTNTELVHTAFISDWKHFFDLRALGTTGAPHPDAKALAMPLYEEFQKRQLI